MPTAASTRPQFGSLPKTAHLKRLLRATARATSSASSTDAARAHLDRDVVVRALGVGDELAGEVGADLRHGIREVGRRAGATPEAPEASSTTVSLVDMHPSESTRSKVSRSPRAGRRRGRRGGDGIRRDDDEHRRERRGEHAGALGHAADRPALALGDRGLRDGVGGEDRLGRGRAAVGGQGPGSGVDAGQQQVHRQPLADEAGRADDDVTRGDPQGGSDVLRGARGCPGSRGLRCRRWRPRC